MAFQAQTNKNANLFIAGDPIIIVAKGTVITVERELDGIGEVAVTLGGPPPKRGTMNKADYNALSGNVFSTTTDATTSDKFVDLEALNVRSAPIVSPSTRIGILHLGQRIEEQGPHDQAGWVKIKAEINGASVEGVVKAEIDGKVSLRDPVSAAREALVAEAIKEWLRFEKGQGIEHHDPFFKFVGQMWQAIGLDLDGKDRDTPWSAAAISFMVRHAGQNLPKYKNFKFAASHSKYLHDSIVKRKEGDTNAPFWGFRLHEKRPEIGDIVGRWRETPRDFDDVEMSDAFKSHSDIIVSVSPDFVLAIGGNIDQSVSITRYEKTAAGFLAAKNAVFMHMVNQA